MTIAAPWCWTEDDIATLTRMHAAGSGNKEIAAEIGCNDSQVEYRVAQMKLGKRPRTVSARSIAAKSGPIGTPVDPWAGHTARDAAFARAMGDRWFEDVRLKASTAPARVLPVRRSEHRGASSLEIAA
jgi:hypothetical protein